MTGELEDRSAGNNSSRSTENRNVSFRDMQDATKGSQMSRDLTRGGK